MATMSRSDALTRLSASRTAYRAIRPRVVAGEPWPLAEDFGTGPEASWGPREVLAHLEEMLAFWWAQHGLVVASGRGAGEALPFGRVADNEARLVVLERDRKYTIDDLFELVDDGIARWERRTAATSDEQGARVGLHPRNGEMTADDVRDRFVVTHLEDHLGQLEGALAAK